MADENSDVSKLKNKIKELLKLEIGNKIQLEHLLNDFILKVKPLSKSDQDYVNKLFENKAKLILEKRMQNMSEAVKSLYIETSELKSKGVDVSEQLKILVKTDVLLSGTNPDKISLSRANLATVSGDLCFKKKTLAQSLSFKGGIGVLLFLTAVTLIFFVIVVPISIFVPDMPQSQSDDGMPIGMINTSLDFQIILVPAYVYVWGIMGTLSYLLWACVTHIANKDFDNYYVPWYFLRIPLGAIMAAAIYFVVFSGFVTVGDKIEMESNIPFIVLAFISGFSIRYSMNTLDRVTSAIMPNKQDVKTNITDPPKEVT